jgi:hypothetical protein
MRYAALLVLVCVALAAPDARTQDAKIDDRAFFDKNIGKLIKLEPTPIVDLSLDKVFRGQCECRRRGEH